MFKRRLRENSKTLYYRRRILTDAYTRLHVELTVRRLRVCSKIRRLTRPSKSSPGPTFFIKITFTLPKNSKVL